MANRKRAAKKRKAAARGARERPERQQDPRLTATQIRAVGDEPVTAETWAVLIAPVELADGRELALPTPQVVAMNLVEAKQHQRRGVRLRRNIIGNLSHREGDDRWGPSNTNTVIDCLRELSSAVLFGFTALEALGNHTIEQLEDEDAFVEVERRDEVVQVKRDQMVRTLNVAEKLDLVVPLFTGQPSIKGRAEWAGYKRLKRLRDDLVHPKGRGYALVPRTAPDPKKPGVYGQVIRGDADAAADDAIAVVRAARPDFLPEHVMRELVR